MSKFVLKPDRGLAVTLHSIASNSASSKERIRSGAVLECPACDMIYCSLLILMSRALARLLTVMKGGRGIITRLALSVLILDLGCAARVADVPEVGLCFLSIRSPEGPFDRSVS
jgi:hypothetical protein